MFGSRFVETARPYVLLPHDYVFVKQMARNNHRAVCDEANLRQPKQAAMAVQAGWLTRAPVIISRTVNQAMETRSEK